MGGIRHYRLVASSVIWEVLVCHLFLLTIGFVSREQDFLKESQMLTLSHVTVLDVALFILRVANYRGFRTSCFVQIILKQVTNFVYSGSNPIRPSR